VEPGRNSSTVIQRQCLYVCVYGLKFLFSMKRFERKTSDSQSSYAQDFEGEEQLPNGFYKIRSKNLDVLFKKDYYAHK